MCIGIPMQVERCEGLVAFCRHGDEVRQIDMSLVGPQPPGTWVLAFLNTAREVMDEQRAEETLKALAALDQVMQGQAADIDALFADLVDREPPLPPHLAAQVGKPANANAAADTEQERHSREEVAEADRRTGTES